MARNSNLFQVFIKSLPQSASLTAPSSEGACLRESLFLGFICFSDGDRSFSLPPSDEGGGLRSKTEGEKYPPGQQDVG